MNILITGGSGMLGSALIRLFHQQHQLRFIARNADIARQLERDYHAVAYLLDLNDRAALIEACKGVDAIIHCAALSSPWGTYEQFFQANVAATQNLVEAARIQNVSCLVHISTTSVYFDYADRWAITEKDALARQWCNDYAKTKYLAERVVENSPIKSIILRPRGIFGPNDRAIVPRVLSSVFRGQLLLPSGRNPVVDLTCVDNVAHAAMLACTQIEDLSHGEIFNISNGEPMPVEMLLQQLLASLNHPVTIRRLPYRVLRQLLTMNEWIRQRLPGHPEPRLTRYSAGLLHHHQTLDITKAREILGYQPHVTINQGIEQYVRWFATQNL
ncbi:NAD-dependent epimerase/dehydratase family protein [Vibrio spartinae]|uniref:3 beta-hydroxysteroid dehydrogenase/Delta 5-->4-isomerase n=1 Tax=Vibrio spartinae TaxID=1918945 RepID=A0A1N6M682_9VIBR|nr:NAD-dependent epimerase/dehydratase family protein [Vibrio spartinae]SIO94958.1 3 beta-hydroxysteroid dehydrogenase/Delta 5-->4-isomerase [Vibrio spartinae]